MVYAILSITAVIIAVLALILTYMSSPAPRRRGIRGPPGRNSVGPTGPTGPAGPTGASAGLFSSIGIAKTSTQHVTPLDTEPPIIFQDVILPSNSPGLVAVGTTGIHILENGRYSILLTVSFQDALDIDIIPGIIIKINGTQRILRYNTIPAGVSSPHNVFANLNIDFLEEIAAPSIIEAFALPSTIGDYDIVGSNLYVKRVS